MFLRVSCAATTCAHDPAPVCRLGGTRHRNTSPGSGRLRGAVRSSRVGRKTARNFFSCVTTRGQVSESRRLERLANGGSRQAGSPLAFGGCVLLTNFGTLPPLLLTLGGLPAKHLFAALGILAVTLIPTHRLVDATASFAQAHARPQPVGASERRVGCGIVEMSQGRCFLLPGRPGGSYKAFRATFILGSAVPAGPASSATILPWLSIPLRTSHVWATGLRIATATNGSHQT
jgi:hypothetical protein